MLVRDDGTGPVLIDFERCKHSSAPQNVLQVCQFLNSKSLERALAANGKGLVLECSAMRDYCRMYKGNNYQEGDFERILAIVQGAVSPKHGSSSSRAVPSARLANGGGVTVAHEMHAEMDPVLLTTSIGLSHDLHLASSSGACKPGAGAKDEGLDEDMEEDMEALLRAKGLAQAQGVVTNGVVTAGPVQVGDEQGRGGGGALGWGRAYEETLVEAYGDEEEGEAQLAMMTTEEGTTAVEALVSERCVGGDTARRAGRAFSESAVAGVYSESAGAMRAGGWSNPRQSEAAVGLQSEARAGGADNGGEEEVVVMEEEEDQEGEEESLYIPSIYADTCWAELPGATSRRGR